MLNQSSMTTNRPSSGALSYSQQLSPKIARTTYSRLLAATGRTPIRTQVSSHRCRVCMLVTSANCQQPSNLHAELPTCVHKQQCKGPQCSFCQMPRRRSPAFDFIYSNNNFARKKNEMMHRKNVVIN